MTQRILVADDDEGVLSALNILLKSEGYAPLLVTSPEQALAEIRRTDFSLVLIDLNYSQDTTSGREGLKLISAVRKIDELIPLVVMTGWGTVEVAVSAMKYGANDFIQKPWDNDRLLTIIKNQIKLCSVQKHSQRLSRHNQLLREQISRDGELITESAITKKVLSTIKQVADSGAPVLLTGENGTGKSMFARCLHDNSSQKQFPFVSVNMGAIAESLFESEMFGHVKGAFTDARSTRIGRFELADEGSLFLDEISNMTYKQQGKLLRVLEDRKFEKVGSSKTQMVSVRLISATNADLYKGVEEGWFRKDLLYRVNAVQIEIPPLRLRTEDIVPLAECFLRRAEKQYSESVSSITKAAQDALKEYTWPGNVRELSHVIERALIMCDGSVIEREHLGLGSPPSDIQESISNGEEIDRELSTLEEIESSTLKKRLAYFEGDARKAAESLGMSRSAFYRRYAKNRKRG